MEVSPQAKAEELIAQHLSAMLVLGNFSYLQRVDFAKRNAFISARTAQNAAEKNGSYWVEVQKFIDKYTIQ
jgi:hypothetical protein